MTEPPQTLQDPQRLRALEQANTIRLARAELKRRIAEGEVSAAEVILECPEEARRWTVADLLMSQRRWGSSRCRKFLERNHIGELKHVGTLTERQRALLARELRACVRVGEAIHGECAAELESSPRVRELLLV